MMNMIRMEEKFSTQKTNVSHSPPLVLVLASMTLKMMTSYLPAFLFIGCKFLLKSIQGLAMYKVIEKFNFALMFFKSCFRIDLRDKDPVMYERLKFLMEGSIDDLTNGSINSSFTSEVHEIVNEIFGKGISKRDIIQCIGIKRTNACDLSSIDIEGGVAIYPTYALMNSNCYCNTRYF